MIGSLAAPTASAGDFPFNPLALELFRLQCAANPAYGIFCQSRRVAPDSTVDWTQIPAVPTAAFKEFEMTCLPTAQRTRVFHSSGTTTDRPSRHFHGKESLATYEASLWPWFEANVLRAAHENNAPWSVAILSPSPESVPHSSLVHMFETVGGHLHASADSFLGEVGADNAWRLQEGGTVARFSELAAQSAPTLVLGTAFMFVHLIDHLEVAGLRFKLPPGSRVMETGGYKGRSREIPKDQLHRLISHRLGVSRQNIVCEYGMSELSSQAYDTCRENAASGCFQFPPWARAQVISPETGLEVGEGGTGLIRVVDLANTFSVLAVQTEDMAVRHGNGFELLGRAAFAETRGCSLMAA
jgi:hypothetical protein